MNIREQSEELERKYLSPYASLSCESQGRDREEEQCDISRETGIELYIVKRLEE